MSLHLVLARYVPHLEHDITVGGGEGHGQHAHTVGGCGRVRGGGWRRGEGEGGEEYGDRASGILQ